METVDTKLRELRETLRRREERKNTERRKIREAQAILAEPQEDLSAEISAKSKRRVSRS